MGARQYIRALALALSPSPPRLPFVFAFVLTVNYLLLFALSSLFTIYMAIINPSRGHAHRLRAETSTAATTVTATPTAVVSTDDHEITPATKALAALVVIFGVLIIGLVAWRIGVWRRKKMRTGAASNSINIASMRSKRFRKAIPIAFNDPPSTPALEKGSMDPDTAVSVNVLLLDKPLASIKRTLSGKFQPMPSPPPTYQFNGSGAASTPAPPPITIPLTARPPGIDALVKEYAPSPIVPTPRTASFPDGKSRPSTTSSKVSGGLQPPADLPRIVTVLNTFVPSLSDELPIRLGETLRMLEEYEDGWCLVQRMRAPDQKGVIPQFCVH